MRQRKQPRAVNHQELSQLQITLTFRQKTVNSKPGVHVCQDERLADTQGLFSFIDMFILSKREYLKYNLLRTIFIKIMNKSVCPGFGTIGPCHICVKYFKNYFDISCQVTILLMMDFFSITLSNINSDILSSHNS